MLHLNTEYYLSRIIVTIVILLVDLILSIISKKVIDVLFVRINYRITSERAITRTQTVRSLLKNVVDFVMFLIAVLIILSFWGINTVPIITGAGILGLTVSFGAQTFIKDLISGVFIILEDQFHIGDKIKVADYEGEVENISLRLTVLKDKKGNVVYIPNSEIKSVVRLNSPNRTTLP